MNTAWRLAMFRDIAAWETYLPRYAPPKRLHRNRPNHVARSHRTTVSTHPPSLSILLEKANLSFFVHSASPLSVLAPMLTTRD